MIMGCSDVFVMLILSCLSFVVVTAIIILMRSY